MFINYPMFLEHVNFPKGPLNNNNGGGGNPQYLFEFLWIMLHYSIHALCNI